MIPEKKKISVPPWGSVPPALLSNQRVLWTWYHNSETNINNLITKLALLWSEVRTRWPPSNLIYSIPLVNSTYSYSPLQLSHPLPLRERFARSSEQLLVMKRAWKPHAGFNDLLGIMVWRLRSETEVTKRQLCILEAFAKKNQTHPTWKIYVLCLLRKVFPWLLLTKCPNSNFFGFK